MNLPLALMAVIFFISSCTAIDAREELEERHFEAWKGKPVFGKNQYRAEWEGLRDLDNTGRFILCRWYENQQKKPCDNLIIVPKMPEIEDTFERPLPVRITSKKTTIFTPTIRCPHRTDLFEHLTMTRDLKCLIRLQWYMRPPLPVRYYYLADKQCSDIDLMRMAKMYSQESNIECWLIEGRWPVNTSGDRKTTASVSDEKDHGIFIQKIETLQHFQPVVDRVHEGIQRLQFLQPAVNKVHQGIEKLQSLNPVDRVFNRK